MYNHQDKQEFFGMLDEVSLSLSVAFTKQNKRY